MLDKIKEISGIFHDVKGLIHTPSYMASEQIRNGLNDPRFITHQPNDFQQKLEEFYESKAPGVFLSPVCQLGVDFKGDRARLQIILRVPYLNTSSKFVEDKVKNDFPWYNYQSLITFGQQIGRVNRSADDYGATFLIDERFNKFISRNNKVLPGWVKEAIVYRS
jgi:Rad3-related DNA helicase